MDNATARRVVRAMTTIGELGEAATEAERASIAETLRRLADKLDAPKAKPVQAPAKAPTMTSLTAAQIVQAARGVVRAGGGFGDHKAFISEVYDALAPMTTLSLAEFKASLPEMNRRGELSLSRADLPEAMDARMVRRSHLRDLGADFHFVRVD